MELHTPSFKSLRTFKLFFLLLFLVCALKISLPAWAQDDSDYGGEALPPMEQDESVVEMLSPDEKFDLEVKIEQPIVQPTAVIVSPSATLPSNPRRISPTPVSKIDDAEINHEETQLFSE